MIEYKLIQGDNRKTLPTIPDNSVDCCITSPPYYGLRNYGTKHLENGVWIDEQIGLETSPEEYIQELVKVFHEVKRVLKPEGTLWVNIGDSYCCSGDKGELQDPKQREGRNGQVVSVSKKIEGIKPKDLIGIPWMLAFALRQDGWYLRQDIIWAKKNCMPEPVKDRCTKSHEYIFLLSKSPNYYYDADVLRTPCTTTTTTRSQYSWNCDAPSAGNGIHTDKMGNRFAPEGGANKRDVWFISNSGGYKDTNGVHYATYPTELVKPMVLAGCPDKGVVLDPFNGSGTTGEVAMENGRNYIGLELSEDYIELSERRLKLVKENSGSLFDFF